METTIGFRSWVIIREIKTLWCGAPNMVKFPKENFSAPPKLRCLVLISS